MPVPSVLGLPQRDQIGFPIGGGCEWYAATPPEGFLLSDGTSYRRSEYRALFNAIGITYGSVDNDHFNVPNKKGVVGVGLDVSVASFNALANTGGAETHTHAAHVLGASGAEAAHTHAGSGNTGAEAAHTHDDGTLVNAAELSHTHSGSGNTGAEAAHTHAVGTYDAAAELSHTHAAGTYASPTSGGESAHTHTQGVTGGEAAHTHSGSGNTGSESAHVHAGPSHTHNLSSAGWADIAIGLVGPPDLFERRVTATSWTATHSGSMTSHATSTAAETIGTELGGATDAGGTANTGAGGSHLHTTGAVGAGTSHNHAITGTTTAGTSHVHTTGAVGAGSSHTHAAGSISNNHDSPNNDMPFVVVNWIIRAY